MKCYNRSAPEYQVLTSKYKSVLAVDSIINKWQDLHKTENFPTLSDAEEMMESRKVVFNLKKREFAETVLANLSRKNWISKLGKDYYVNKSSGLTRGFDAGVLWKNIRNINKYLEFKNIPLETIEIQKKKPYRITVKENLFTRQDIIQESRENDGVHTADVIEHLVRMFPGVNVQAVSVAAAKEYYDRLPTWQKAKLSFDQVKSYYVNNQVKLIEGRTTAETSIEEILHPFIDGIKNDNIKLFEGLLSEAKKNFPQLTQQIEDSYTERRGFTTEERDLELVTQALSRHFNKEFKEEPTIGWEAKVKEFLEWFMNIIENLHEYLTGKGLQVSVINPNATMTDLARLLNTKDLEFTTEEAVSRKIRYSLNPEKKKMLDKIMGPANPVQKALMMKMFHLAITSKKDTEGSLTANVSELTGSDPLVVLNEPNHTYYDLETGEEYTSVTKAIKGTFVNKGDKQLNLDIGNDFDAIADGLAAGLTYEEILPRLVVVHKSMKKVGKGKDAFTVSNAFIAYNQLLGTIETIKQNGSIIIPQVIFADADSKIAGMADLVVISPEGKIGIIDLKTGKGPIKAAGYDKPHPLEKDSILKEKGVDELSTRNQHGIQVNTYRRMVENLGYEVLDQQSFGISTLHMNVDIEGYGKKQIFKDKFEYDGWESHAPSKNQPWVDKIVPIKKKEVSAADIANAEEAAGVDNPTRDEDFLSDEDAMPEEIETGALYAVLFEALQDFTIGLKKRKEAIELMRDGIFLDKTRQENVENIADTMSKINVALNEGRDAVEIVYTELLRDSIAEIKKFTEYIKDPINFNKNKTQSTLVLKLMSELNKLETVTAADGTRTQGLIDEAMDNYFRSFVIDNSNRDFSPEDLDELMTKAKDISLWEASSYDLDSSSDPLSALMAKLYKRKKQEVLDRVDNRNNSIRVVLAKLLKLSNGNKIDYSFMLQEDNTRYIQEIGYDYFRMAADLRNDIYADEDMNEGEYIFIEDLETAKPEDIAFNKELYKRKKKYTEFLRSEIKTSEGYKDGTYHRYTKEFKVLRAKYQIYNPIGNGFWERRKDVSDAAYARFEAREFDVRDAQFATFDSNNEFTGVTRLDTIRVPKKKHSEIRSVSAPTQSQPNGKDMRDAKWVKLMNPDSALGEAQKDFYLMFRRMFEEELLAKLPMSVRDNMLGKIPLQKDALYDTLKDKPNIVTRLWAKATRSATDFFTETGSAKKVMTDENGNFIDTLPIWMVGSPRNEKALKTIENKIMALKKNYNSGALSTLQYEEQKQELEGKRSRILAQPTRDEISKDLGDSLLRFSHMAENYEVMGTIEDTLTGMIKILEKREYTPASGAKLMGSIKGKMKEVGIPGVSTGGEAEIVKRAKKWMKMVYYDNDKMTRNWFDKATAGLIRYSSLSYVAFNPFGNINNYTIGRINNAIEQAGGLFFGTKEYTRATYEFNKRGLSDVVRKTSYLATKKAYEKYIPHSKYEVLVELYRMMDAKSDIRESGQFDKKETLWDKFTGFGYMLQDAAEYNVQTKVGMAVLMTKQIKNSKTGETLSLYDAYTLNGDGTATLKEGYDTLIDREGKELKDFSNDVRYDIRNEIREVNKQIHGNYAYEDRMVIQSHALGELGAQFHKWVIPAIKARFRPEYFDENVGWLEGRYLSMWSFMKYAATHIGEMQKWSTNFQEQVRGGPEQSRMKMLNVWRTSAELALMMTTVITAILLEMLFEDDDDDSVLQKRLENALIYQADRAHKEMIQFMPFLPPFTGTKQIYQMMKSPIASTRTLGELAEALSATMDYGYGKMFLSEKEFRTNPKYVYQQKPRKGYLKLAKQWMDAVPILYGIQRWYGYDRQKSFYIK